MGEVKQINIKNPTYYFDNELIRKYKDAWSGIKNKIEAINSGECHYEKDFIKIKFNSEDDVPLNKPLKFHMITIITMRSVFEGDGKLYAQVFLDNALFEVSMQKH